MGNNAQGSRNVYKSPLHCRYCCSGFPPSLPSFLFHCFLYNYLPSSAAAVFPANIYLMDQSPPPYRHTGCLTKSVHNSSPVLGGSDNLTVHVIQYIATNNHPVSRKSLIATPQFWHLPKRISVPLGGPKTIPSHCSSKSPFLCFIAEKGSREINPLLFYDPARRTSIPEKMSSFRSSWKSGWLLSWPPISDPAAWKLW